MARDLYQTPAEAVAPLAPFLKPNTIFAEPCAGAGLLIDAVEAHGHLCVWAGDVHPLRGDIYEADARTCGPNGAEMFITNPPWSRDLLHYLIVVLSDQLPTWLLFDADWKHTGQATAFMPRCRAIVSVGRVRWIFPGSKTAGFDNAAWYLFGRPIPNSAPLFFGRGAQPLDGPARAARVCYDCGILIDRFGKWHLQNRNGVPSPVHKDCACPSGHRPDAETPLLDWIATAPPPAPVGRVSRCGLCVHRNANEDAAEGHCSPHGLRRRDDPPCDYGFPHTELRAALYGKKPKT